MRLLILAALLTVSQANLYDDFWSTVEKYMDKLTGDDHERFGNLTDEQIAEFKKSFSRTNMDQVAERLGKIRSVLRKNIQNLTSAQRSEFAERMANWKNKKRSAQVRQEGDNLEEVNAKLNLTENFYQGDIVLTVPQLNEIVPEENATRSKRQAYKTSFYPQNIWLGQTVYYFFDISATDRVKSVFQQAAAFWQENTCITFAESRTATNKIRVFKGEGCYSYIGKIGGQQDMSLGAGCDSFGTAAHELGHALGFFHTQARHDRDSYIYLNASNVKNDWLDQFNKETTATNDNYGKTYDYGSVMHYGGKSASQNKLPTMVSKNPLYQDTMGSNEVSFYDLDIMNEHYQCKKACGKGSIVCGYGGFPHPRACTTECICPGGYGGNNCGERPSGCGQTLTATTNAQTFSSTVGDNSTTTVNDRFTKCNYRITAPVGRKIEVKITQLTPVSCMNGCVYGGVEIKAGNDPRNTGYRFCCKEDVNTTINSISNLVPIIVYNRYYRDSVTIQYRFV